MVNEPVQPDDSNRTKTILGIAIIQTIVSKANISSPREILSSLKQIFYFYNLIPEEWKKKAYWIFEKLWNRKKIIISTNPDKAGEVYNTDISFDDDRLQNLFNRLPKTDQAIMLQGKVMQDMINRGLHSDANEKKVSIKNRYGQRGVNIVNMITTNDISYTIEEIEKLPSTQNPESKFNEWADNYLNIVVLVSPYELENVETIKNRIKAATKNNTKRNYLLIHLSGRLEDGTKLILLIAELKEKKELQYNNFEPNIIDSGFYKTLTIKINF